MVVGIYDLKDANGRDLPAQQAYEKILAANGVRSVRLRAEQPDFWDQVKGLDLFIMRFRQYDSDLQQARDLLPVIEGEYGIPCYPNLAAAWHYDDKIKQYFLLRAAGFPMTECWVFYEKKSAREWVSRAAYPVVFKLRGGAGSQNVLLVKSAGHARRLVDRMFGRGVRPGRWSNCGALGFPCFSLYREFHRLGGNLNRRIRGLDSSPNWQVQKNYILFQKFLPDNPCDTRVTVIGDRAFAFRRFVRENDFRASGSGRIDHDPRGIDLRCVEIAFAVSRRMGFPSMAYDFLVNGKGEPEFCEISYTYVSRAVHDCPGYWDSRLDWHPGNFWPEYLHLVDALGRNDLKVPEMDD